MVVVVVPYSDTWPVMFEQEAARLQAVLAPWLVGAVEHVGSTAIPGCAAKPVLDLLAPVSDLNAVTAAVPLLADLGYRHADHRPDEALWFYAQHGEAYDTRTRQLHLTLPSSALWQERLVFRDALRADPRLASEYQSLKQALAAAGGDLTGYTDFKRAFVAAVLRTRGVALR